MPVTHTVDHGKREVNAVAVGNLTLDDLCTHMAKERFDKGLAYPEFIDASGATINLSGTDVRVAVEMLRSLARGGHLGPTAVLVGNDVSFGTLRMLEIQLEGTCAVRPFHTRLEALRWLAGDRYPP